MQQRSHVCECLGEVSRLREVVIKLAASIMWNQGAREPLPRQLAEGAFDGGPSPKVDKDIVSSPPQVVVSHASAVSLAVTAPFNDEVAPALAGTLEACSSASECLAPAPNLTNVALGEQLPMRTVTVSGAENLGIASSAKYEEFSARKALIGAGPDEPATRLTSVTLHEHIQASSPVDVGNAAPSSITDMSESGHADTGTRCASDATDVQKASGPQGKDTPSGVSLAGAELSRSSGANNALDPCTLDSSMMTDSVIEAGNELKEGYSSLVTSLSQQFGRVHPKSAQAGKIRRLVSQVLEDYQRDCEVVRGMDVDLSTLQRIVSRLSVSCQRLPPSWAGYKYGAQGYRRPGRGKSTGLRLAAVLGGVQIRGSLSLVCKAAAAFFMTTDEVLKFDFVLRRVVYDGFGTVRMYIAGGVDANVHTCFSVGGTDMNGVTVRLFFNVGCIVDPRVVLIFCFSPGVFGWSFCPAALSLLRGFGAAWSTVLEARTCLLSLCVCVSLLLTVSSPMCCVVLFLGWWLPPSWAGYKYGALTAGKHRYCPGLLVVAAVPGGVQIRGLYNWHLVTYVVNTVLGSRVFLVDITFVVDAFVKYLYHASRGVQCSFDAIRYSRQSVAYCCRYG